MKHEIMSLQELEREYGIRLKAKKPKFNLRNFIVESVEGLGIGLAFAPIFLSLFFDFYWYEFVLAFIIGYAICFIADKFTDKEAEAEYNRYLDLKESFEEAYGDDSILGRLSDWLFNRFN